MFIHRNDPQYRALKSLAERPDRANVPTILHHHMPEKKNSDAQKVAETGNDATGNLEAAFESLSLGCPVAAMPNLVPDAIPFATAPILGGWAPIMGVSEADRRFAAASVWGAPVSPESKGLMAPAEFPPLSLAAGARYGGPRR